MDIVRALQYIGARYVPKFYENPDTGDMTWKSGVGYEPLTEVIYNDDTYTSKIPVPSSVGNPAENPTYWAKTANYNAALAALQAAVNNIDNVELPAIRGDIIENHNGLRRNISDRKFIFISDSYSDPEHADTNRWDYYTRWFLGIPSGKYKLIGDSGAGFYHVGNHGYNLTELVNLQSVDTDVTDVFVVAGINDLNDPDADVQTAITNFVAAVKSKYPNAFIQYSFMQRNYGATATKMITRRSLYNTMMMRSGVKADPEGFATLWNRRYIGSDGVHPSTGAYNGYLLIGCRVGALLLDTEYNEFETLFDNNPSFSNPIGTVDAKSIRFVKSRNIVKVYINLAFSGATINLINNGYISLGTFDNYVFNENEVYYLRIPCRIPINGTYRDCHIQIETNGEIKLYNDSGSDITGSQINPFANGGCLAFETLAEYC